VIQSKRALFLVLLQRAKEGIRSVGVAFEGIVDDVVVAVQNIEAVLEAALGFSEERKIVLVLDRMMPFELTEQELQPRREEAGELVR